MQYGFYFDQSRCIGCNACTVACKDWNQVNPGPVRWRMQNNYENGKSVFENLTMACNHCEEPACVPACGRDAIMKMDNGIVLVNREVCVGLLDCIAACPFAAPQIAESRQEQVKEEKWEIEHPMQKCTFCWDRVQDGDGPVCVSSCPVRAMDYGDISELQMKYPDAVRLNKEDFPYAFVNNDTDTKPAFLIKKRKALKITKLA